MKRISNYMIKSKDELVGIVQDIREPLGLYKQDIVENSELELLDKEDLIEYLILLEGELYLNNNEDKEVIKLLFDEVAK